MTKNFIKKTMRYDDVGMADIIIKSVTGFSMNKFAFIKVVNKADKNKAEFFNKDTKIMEVIFMKAIFEEDFEIDKENKTLILYI